MHLQQNHQQTRRQGHYEIDADLDNARKTESKSRMMHRPARGSPLRRRPRRASRGASGDGSSTGAAGLAQEGLTRAAQLGGLLRGGRAAEVAGRVPLALFQVVRVEGPRELLDRIAHGVCAVFAGGGVRADPDAGVRR